MLSKKELLKSLIGKPIQITVSPELQIHVVNAKISGETVITEVGEDMIKIDINRDEKSTLYFSIDYISRIKIDK